MAKTILSPLLGSLSGSLAATTFTNSSRGLQITRRRRLPSPPSDLQLAARADFAAVRALWDSLSSDIQTAWANHALMHTLPDNLAQRRHRSAYHWFAWWRPWAECGIPFALAPDYGPPNHSIHSDPPNPVTLDFEEGGPYTVEISSPIYPAYDQIARIRIARTGPAYRTWPRLWTSLPPRLFTAQQFTIDQILTDAGIQLRTGEHVTITIATITKGNPNYWPTITVSAKTTVT